LNVQDYVRMRRIVPDGAEPEATRRLANNHPEPTQQP
jgi:hypothetical protein